MMEQTEFFSQLFCFTPFWGVVDLLLILHFFLSWRRSIAQTGWKIDLWFLTLLLTIFPALCLLYPFNASIFNAPFMRGCYDQVLPFIDRAFFISALGYVSVWSGRYLFDLSRGKLPLPFLFSTTHPFCELIENNIKSRRGYLFVSLSAIVFGIIILLIQFKAQVFFNARGFFLKHHVLRPFFNLTISIFPIAFGFLALRYIQFKEKRCLVFLLILVMMTLFFGIRSLGLGGILTLITYWIFYREGRFSLLKLFGICSALFVCAVILGNVREERYNLCQSLGAVFINFAYGNNFSDTRDFAWVLAFWDGEYLYGKTYLAALISFVPRFLSSFREQWSISMYTNGITGFDSELMPGLRPGFFGEAFLNFGYIGVVLFGLSFGATLRYADSKIKECVTKSKDLIKGYSHLFVFGFVSTISISAAMWSFYVFLIVHTGLLLVRGPIRKDVLTPS